MKKLLIANSATGDLLFSQLINISSILLNSSLSPQRTQQRSLQPSAICYQFWLIFVNLQQFAPDQIIFNIQSTSQTIIFATKNGLLLIAEFDVQVTVKTLDKPLGFMFSEQEEINEPCIFEQLSLAILTSFQQSFEKTLAQAIIYKKRFDKFSEILPGIVYGFCEQKFQGTVLSSIPEWSRKFEFLINIIKQGQKVDMVFGGCEGKNIIVEQIGEQIYCYQAGQSTEVLSILRQNSVYQQ
ncbi:hypothetical protein SS50377_20151 [Spironucleus salmonicida]|uniref:Uncharacterized protein n=1 Tax=Spironucleus salmonicida TaxID=348837 RepID=V6LNB6_9EUKA|nr:hypothetical protein SS50377_20151 [Spironucleus salmonicida]|eukprot:EST45206.1 Hypothetical protein SS50377_14778 [Spironucleus salmonicida]